MKQPKAYYNEIEPFAAEWLRNLIAADLIAYGDVDTRSIEDVRPSDLAGYTQHHFFAGIGVWSYALRLAGWPDERAVWTGSCPCQPFSAAGERRGADDERHLWPAWFHLIEQCRPRVIFGEQVEAAVRHGWLDLVQSDLEGIGYAVGAAVVPAAGVGAPHIRQRLWFVGDAGSQRRQQDGRSALGDEATNGRARRDRSEAHGDHFVGSAGEGCMADDDDDQGQHRRAASRVHERRPTTSGDGAAQGDVDGAQRHDTDGRSAAGELAEPDGMFPEQPSWLRAGSGSSQSGGPCGEPAGSSAPGFWSDCEWLWCRDGKYRPVEPGTFPLAHGTANRVGRLRAYGNAIVAPVAAEVIAAYLEGKT